MASLIPLHRRTVRIRAFDYTQAACYFVTICAKANKSLLGRIRDGAMRPNIVGKIVVACLTELPYHFANVEIPVHTIMPNHVHSIVVLRDAVRRDVSPRGEAFSDPIERSVPTIVRSLKSAVTRQARLALKKPGFEAWQRNYFERVIRNDDEFRKTWQYICENPARWEFDSKNPDRREHK